MQCSAKRRLTLMPCALQRRPARTLVHIRVICRRHRRPSHYCSARNVARLNMQFIDSHFTRLQRRIAYTQLHTSCSLLTRSLGCSFSWHLAVRVLRTWHCPSSLACPFLRTRYPPQPRRVWLLMTIGMAEPPPLLLADHCAA